MDDDFDIYGDLDGFEAEAKKESKVIKELKVEIEDLKAKIAEKELEKQQIASKNEILLENISTLLLTAKAELKRKDLLIADIRRQMDNTAFRRDRRNVRKHEKGTQTTLIRMLSQEVQTDSVGTMTTERGTKKAALERRMERRSPFKKIRSERGKSLEKKTSARLVDLRDRLREKLAKEKMTADSLIEKRRNGVQRRDKSRERERERERERARERERRARLRETVRSPEVSPVHFPHPLRVSRQGHGKTDVGSDAKLSQTFIPMNRKELDQYVKEIARKESRLPDECCSGSGRKKKEDTLDTSNSELWDAGLPRTKKEPAAVKPEETLIQSDEIGTTLSPDSAEDVEQNMRVLHGEPTPPATKTPERAQTSIEVLAGLKKTPQPPPLVIPAPQEPYIIEQVPEVSFEDDPRLNDSRELRIVESGETLTEVSAEIVIDKWQVAEETEELEDGEIASSDGDSVHGIYDPVRFAATVSDSSESKRKGATKQNSKLQARTMIEDTRVRKPARRDRNAECTDSKRKEAPKQKSKREARIMLDKLEDSVVRKYSRGDRKTEVESKSKRNRAATLDSSTSTRTSRRNSVREKSTVVEKPEAMPRLPEPVKHSSETWAKRSHGRSRIIKAKDTLKELFGSDEENMLCEPPIAGKRKLSMDRETPKESKKQRVRSKEKDSKDAGRAEVKCSKSTEVVIAPCEVVREQPMAAPTDVLNEDHLLKNATPEEVPSNIPHQEKPPIMDACVVEETSAKSLQLDQPLAEASPEEASETKEIHGNPSQQHEPTTDASSEEVFVEPKQQDRPPAEVDSVDASQNDLLPINASVENASSSNGLPTEQPPVEVPPQQDSIETSHHDASRKEITVNPLQQDQTSPSATSEEVLLESEQISVETSQKDQLPIDASLEEISVNIPLQDQPLPSGGSDKVLVETQQQDEPMQEVTVHTSQSDQLPMDASVEITSASNAFLPKEIRPQEDPVALHDASTNPPQQHPTTKDASSEEVLMETEEQDQPPAEVGASQSDQLPIDASMEEQMSTNLPEQDQPPPTATSDEVLEETHQQDQPPAEVLLPMDAPLASTPAKASLQTNQFRSPDVVIFSNKYGEYRVEDNSETETTIYVTRKKKKKSKSGRANVSTG